MSEDVFILGLEDIIILSVSPYIGNITIPGHYEYEVEAITDIFAIKEGVVFNIIFIGDKKTCVVISVLSRIILSNGSEKITFMAASPLCFLSSKYIERSWVNKSICEVLSEVLLPIESKRRFVLKVPNDFVIKFLYQDSSCDSLNLLHKILEENGLVLDMSFSENTIFISIDRCRAYDKNIEDLSPICLTLEENISPIYSMTERYLDECWRMYGNERFGVGVKKYLKITTEFLGVKVGEVYEYENEKYVVNNVFYCFNCIPPYDIALTLLLAYIHNQRDCMKNLEKSCFGFATSKKTYSNNNISYASCLLKNNDDFPMPITEIMTARIGADVTFSHTYKENSNLFIMRMYNSNKFIALPGAYDNNASALTPANDIITQSDTGNILAFDDGVEFKLGKAFNKINDNWEVNADNIYYKAKKVEENNINSKEINSKKEVIIQVNDNMSVNSKIIKRSSPRHNHSHEILVVSAENLGYSSNETVIGGDVLSVISDKVLLDGKDFHIKGKNIKILAKSILLNTVGASINISQGSISIKAAVVMLGSGAICYNGKVLRY